MAAVTDDFNRANGGLGANWTTVTAGLTISSNAVASTAGTGVAAESTYTGTSFTDDQYAEADVTITGTTYNEANVEARVNAGGSYYFEWSSASSGRYQLRKFTAPSTFTTLGSAVTGVGTTGTRTLRIECEGTTIRAYVDGSLQVSATDSAHTSGAPGLVLYWDTSGTPGTFDNFAAGDVVAIETFPFGNSGRRGI